MTMHVRIAAFLVVAFCLPLLARDHADVSNPRNAATRKDRILTRIGFDRQDYTHHEGAAERFKNKYFRDEHGVISLEKTLAFIRKLFDEHDRNISKNYETEFLETLDVLKSHAHKAHARAAVAYVNNDVLDPYDLYLMPKLTAMVTAMRNHEDNDVVEGLLDDFIRGYIPYFNPNPFDNIFKTKINFMGALYRVFHRPYFAEHTEKIQANNLRISSRKQRRAINAILNDYGYDKAVSDFLNTDEVSLLVMHDFDISTLNPGESALWQPLSEEDKANLYATDPRYFPSADTKKTFDHVMLGGANSDKVKLVYRDDDGVKRRVKLKVGDEVQLELASSAFMKLLGFHTDSMAYAGDVTFYLKDKTFENIEAEIRQKFGQSYNVRYNFARGITDDGERYITWRDTLYEARPDNEKRIAPLDIASWDLQNRREYRGIMLALAWLGVNDMKSDNMKALLVFKDGEWKPEHRIHDLGVSLGKTLTITGPDSILSFPAAYGKVNQFETKIVKNKKNGVKITWNDFAYQHRQYNSATYYDMKWMARKIGALSKHDIKDAFAHAGMHRDLAHLYAIKMIKRRNNIVRAFGLDDEFGIIATPKLKTYSPERYPSIRNGTISVTAYEGKNAIPDRVRTWGSLVSTLLSKGEIPFAKFTRDVHAQGDVTGQFHGAGVAMTYAWNKESSFGPFDTTEFKPGFTVTPRRLVKESPQNLNTVLTNRNGDVVLDENGEAKRTCMPYLVEDSITISVALKAKVKKDQSLPVDGKLGITVAEKTYTYRHFAESIREAWLSPFSIHRLIRNKDRFAARKLRDLENIETYYSVGFAVDAGLETKYFENGVEVSAALQKFGRKLWYRDQFGKLHYLTDRLKRREISAGLFAGKVDAKIANIAALEATAAHQHYRGSVADYIVGVDRAQRVESHDHGPRTKEQGEREQRALQDLRHGQRSDDVALNFSRVYEGASSQKALALAFVFARTRSKFWGKIEDTFANGQVRKLFVGSVYAGNHVGKKDILFSNQVEDIAVRNGKSQRTTVEVDMHAPEKFIITVNSKVYARKIDRASLLEVIDKLNVRYSEDPQADDDQKFFAALRLPDQDEQDQYRKIYAEIKTIVDGENLIARIREMTSEEVTTVIDEFYANEAMAIKKAQFSDDDISRKTRIANQWDHARKKRRILANYARLKALLEDTREEPNWQEIWLTSRDLVHDLVSRYHGIHLLKKFLTHDDDNEGFLVYGEIRNIGDHVTTLERPYGHHANLRNAGSHWGGFNFGKDKVRMVQYFLKYEDPTNQVPIYTPLFMTSEDILGRLEKGQPPNFSGEGI